MNSNQIYFAILILFIVFFTIYFLYIPLSTFFTTKYSSLNRKNIKEQLINTKDTLVNIQKKILTIFLQYDHNIVNMLRNITNNNIIEGTGGEFDPNTFSQEIKSFGEEIRDLQFAKDVSGHSFPANTRGNCAPPFDNGWNYTVVPYEDDADKCHLYMNKCNMGEAVDNLNVLLYAGTDNCDVLREYRDQIAGGTTPHEVNIPLNAQGIDDGNFNPIVKDNNYLTPSKYIVALNQYVQTLYDASNQQDFLR